MPDNHTPATQPDAGATPGEFDFVEPVTENPRLKRRSLKAKTGSLTPASGAPQAARELEREAPPLAATETAASAEVAAAVPDGGPSPRDQRVPTAPPLGTATATSKAATSETKHSSGNAKISQPASAPPKVTPSSTATPSRPAPASAAPRSTTSPKIASTVSPTNSPHGTRPATLYYSSHTRKDKEATLPMKTIPTASSTPTSSATTLPSSVTRPAASSSPTRPTTSVDYRANVDRQAREQKSVGSLLSYVVYGLIALFVVSAGLAIYGADIIFKQLQQQSVTVSDLDARYAAANKDLTAKLAATQDTLNQANAQIARQQDLILKEQEEINKVIVAVNDNTNALKAEKQARTQETASLRARVRDVENRGTSQQKY